MRVVALIQARMDSIRLPGKVLMDLNGIPTIKHIWRRLMKCREIDEVCISWGCTCADDRQYKEGCQTCIEKITNAFGFMPRVWTGPELNLVARHLGAAVATRADAILRVTGDCPLVDPTLVDEMVAHFRSEYPAVEVLTNWYPKALLPDGLDLDMEMVPVLQTLAADEYAPKEEYLGYMFGRGFEVRVMPYPKEDLSHLRITLDLQSDHDAISAILRKVGNDTWDWRKIPRDMMPILERPDYLAGKIHMGTP